MNGCVLRKTQQLTKDWYYYPSVSEVCNESVSQFVADQSQKTLTKAATVAYNLRVAEIVSVATSLIERCST